MKTRILSIWFKISSSYWFVPLLMLFSAVGFSALMIYIDSLVLMKGWMESFDWLYTNKPEGAREVLSTIAGSMITVAGVVFSITIVSLTLASTQFGPRLLGNFMRDKGNQLVLGTFIATFVYSLLILRTIKSDQDSTFVPHLSINFSVIMALFSLGVLIYFIHHTAELIRAHNVITSVYNDLNKSICQFFPETIGKGKFERESWWLTPDVLPHEFDDKSKSISSDKQGYLRIINDETIMKIARNDNLIIRINFMPGDYVVKNDCIANVYSNTDNLKYNSQPIKDCFIIGIERTSEQDIEFSINQLVEISLRALSPGINDPFTAINCLNWLGAALCTIAERYIPSPFRYDEEKNLRIITKPVAFRKFVDLTFDQIRYYGRKDPEVMKTILANLKNVLNRLKDDQDKKVIHEHAEMVLHSSREHIIENNKLVEIESEFNSFGFLMHS